MSTIVALAVVTVLTVAYVLTEHPILFVALAVAAVVLAWVGLRDEPDRDEILAALTEPDRTRLLAIEQELRGDAAVKREVAS